MFVVVPSIVLDRIFEHPNETTKAIETFHSTRIQEPKLRFNWNLHSWITSDLDKQLQQLIPTEAESG